MSSLPPFIQLHSASDGSLIYINKQHIVSVYEGNNKCFIKMAFVESFLEVAETYGQVKTMLRD